MPLNGFGEGGFRLPSGFGVAKSFRIKRVFDYWMGLRRDRPFPAWADISLMDIYEIAPYIAVLDVETTREALHFRYRFCGTGLVETRSNVVPSDPTGRCIEDVEWPFDPMPLIAACGHVTQNMEPILLIPGDVEEYTLYTHERGFFPLGPRDQAVTQVLVCVDKAAGT